MPHAELIESLYAALPEGVPGAERVAAELLDADFELHEFQTGPDRTIYRGPEGYVAWVSQGLEVFDDPVFEPLELAENGDVVLVAVEVRAVGRGSELPVTMVVHHVWDMRDGRPWRIRGYLDADEARAAAGMS